MSGVFASGKRHRGFSRVNGSNLFSKESARIYSDFMSESQVHFHPYQRMTRAGFFLFWGGIDVRVPEGDRDALPRQHFCPCRQRHLFCQISEAF